MSDKILDTPFLEKPRPPKNANVLLLIALAFIISIPVLYFFISILDKYVIRFTNNQVGEFIAYTTTITDESSNEDVEVNLLKYFLQATLTQGLKTGLTLGIILSTFFGLITQLRGEFSFAWTYIKQVIYIIFGSWLVGAIGYQLATNFGLKGVSFYPWLIGGEKGRYFGSMRH